MRHRRRSTLRRTSRRRSIARLGPKAIIGRLPHSSPTIPTGMHHHTRTALLPLSPASATSLASPPPSAPSPRPALPPPVTSTRSCTPSPSRSPNLTRRCSRNQHQDCGCPQCDAVKEALYGGQSGALSMYRKNGRNTYLPDRGSIAHLRRVGWGTTADIWRVACLVCPIIHS
ncbi:hypothetical protein B0H12DRAFT_1117918 [Mycena haematopus]|nr:hypothetical protein B0H12DRAFT_1117918 [Mycena haematopus]